MGYNEKEIVCLLDEMEEYEKAIIEKKKDNISAIEKKDKFRYQLDRPLIYLAGLFVTYISISILDNIGMIDIDSFYNSLSSLKKHIFEIALGSSFFAVPIAGYKIDCSLNYAVNSRLNENYDCDEALLKHAIITGRLDEEIAKHSTNLDLLRRRHDRVLELSTKVKRYHISDDENEDFKNFKKYLSEKFKLLGDVYQDRITVLEEEQAREEYNNMIESISGLANQMSTEANYDIQISGNRLALK
jgi:hypothetical protein